MGFIFSKPVNYVKTKVVDTKEAVATTVTNTKKAVVTKVSDTKKAVVSTVDNTKSGISSRVTNVKNAVKTRIDTVGATFKKGGQAVHNKYTNAKNGVVGRYTRTKDRVHGTYKKVRDTKLTRWQKLKYGLLTFVSIITLIIVISISVDLYQGNQEAAQSKIDTVCELFNFLWSYMQYFAENAYKAGRIGGKFLLKAAATGGSHLWEWTKVAGDYTWEGTKVGAEYAWAGASSTGIFLANGAVVVGQNTAYYSKIGADNFMEGSKVAADYGWYGVSVGSVKAYEGSKVFLQNAAVWVQDGSVYLWEASKTMAVGLATGSVSLSQVIMDVSAFLADKAYWTSLFIAEYTKWFALTTWNVMCSLSSFTGNWTVVIAQGLYDGTIWLSVFIWDFLTSFSIWLYRFSISLADVIATKSIATMRCLWSWTYYITTEGSRGLYVGFNKVGVRGGISLTKKLGAWSLILGEIMWKFVNDLVVTTGNFLYVLSVHIYNVLYIVIAFLLQIVSAIMGIIKFIIGGLVAVVTFMFGGIIWILEEVMGAYMFALHKYNMYREFLFIGFLGLMAFYCMGVMRDRRISAEEEVDGLESSDEDERIGLPDEIDAGEEITGSRKVPSTQIVRTPSGRMKELPPIYEERRKLPSYSKASMSSDSSDDLGLGSDKDIPDALNSSLDSIDLPSGDEREPAVQNVTVTGQQRKVQADYVPRSPRRETGRPVQSGPKSSDSERSPETSPKPGFPISPPSGRPTSSPSAPTSGVKVVGPGSELSRSPGGTCEPASPTRRMPLDASKPKVTMADAPTTSADVHFTAKPSDSPSRPEEQVKPQIRTQPEPVNRPAVTDVSKPVTEQNKAEPVKKPPTETYGAKPTTSPGQQSKVEPRKPLGPTVAPKPGTSPVQQAKVEPAKTEAPKTEDVKTVIEAKKSEAPKSLNQPEPKPPSTAPKPKSSLHEKLAEFDADKSLETVGSPPKNDQPKSAMGAPLSPTKSKILSSSPPESKVAGTKPAFKSSSGFQSPGRRQAPKMSPVGSPTKPSVGFAKSPPKANEAPKSPPSAVQNVPNSPSKSLGPASPPKATSAPKPIPGSSPLSESSAGSVSPPSKTGKSPPAATSSTSPTGRVSSIRMLQQRLSQGASEAKPSGVRVRLADTSTSPKKS